MWGGSGCSKVRGEIRGDGWNLRQWSRVKKRCHTVEETLSNKISYHVNLICLMGWGLMVQIRRDRE